jgi:hypothetical protein
LRLRTFGGLSFESEDGPVGGAATQRRRLSLLAVLADAGERGLTRDKPIGLWSSSRSTPRAGAATLLRSSRAIRAAIGDAAGLAQCDAELAQSDVAA